MMFEFREYFNIRRLHTIKLVLGDGVRRNIASIDPSERAMLRDAFIELN
jgi:hypothetical protein